MREQTAMLEAAPKKVWKMDEREEQKRSAAHSDVGQNQEQKTANPEKKKRQKEKGRSCVAAHVERQRNY